MGQFPVTVLCRVLKVGKSGFYDWKGRKPSTRSREDEAITQQIRECFEASRETYGSPRILRDLREKGSACGKHRLARLMRQAGIRAVAPRRFVATTDSRHALPVAENLLDRDFDASAANVKWASDITYLWTGEGWLYLAVVLDLFSRRVVGWSLQARLDRSLVVKALQAALGQRRPGPGLLHHSDPVTCGD